MDTQEPNEHTRREAGPQSQRTCEQQVAGLPNAEGTGRATRVPWYFRERLPD